jgi:two-component system sensor histidine kinase EvgS
MRSRLVNWFLITLAAFGLFACEAGARGESITLSPQEQEWLLEHPTVTVGLYDSGWPPFEALQKGEPVGLGVDYLRAAVGNLGLRLETRRYESWPAVLEAACRGEVDVVINLSLTAARTRCLVFTSSYFEAPLALAARRDDARPFSRQDLSGLRVVVERDFITEQAAQKRYPAAVHLQAPDTEQALKMVAEGQADVYIGNPYVITELTERDRIRNLGLVRPSDLPFETLHFAVPNAKQPLAQALDAALDEMSDAQQRALQERWLPPLRWKAERDIGMTTAERTVLNQPLRVGFAPNWAPISFLDEDGEPDGLAGEYLRQLRALGANLQMVPVKDWQDVRDKMAAGDVDIVMGVPAGAPFGGGEWVYSQPFLTVANVIVIRDQEGTVLDVHDLDGKRICVSDPGRLRDWVLAQAPAAQVVSARSADEGLALLSQGAADAYIGNLAVVDKRVRERYSGKLHIVAPAGIDDELTLGARRSHAPVVELFDRLLAMMPLREREALRGNWLAVEYRSGIRWRAVLKWLVPLLLVLLTAVLVHGVGYWRLRREVKERRRVEKRLAEVTGNLPAVVYQAKRIEDGTLSFPFIAGDMPSLFGLTAEQAMDNERDVFARVHPEDQPYLAATVERSAISFEPLVAEFRAMSDRGWRWVRSRGQPHRADGNVVLWSGYWIDVTEAHAQSKALKEAKETAERAAAAKADFLATMSHEIRTPMSGVLGMLEVLAHTQLDGEQQQVLTTIEDSAQMLGQILDDILDFSKMEAGALSLEPTPASLRNIIANVQQMVSGQAMGKGLRISNQIDPVVAPVHAVDGTRLRQILFNLLSNAIKFTEHGEISIELAAIKDEKSRQKLRLSVTDTGIGISAEQQERLFRPFAQAEMSTARRYGGTGLGLSICQKLVQMMGGELQLKSALGKGTCVEVTLVLPVIEGEVSARVQDVEANGGTRTSTPITHPDWTGRRVLIAEDHPTNQALMRWRMQQLGLDGEVVGDGSAALLALRTSRYDLLITDCLMPGMDGYALTRAIRQKEAETGQLRLPVIALTASALGEEVERCRQAGMDDFLVKPVALPLLRDTIARWLPAGSVSAPSAENGLDRSPGELGEEPPDFQALVRRFGSKEIAIRMLDSLIATTREDMAALDAAIESADAARIHEQLHRIAGGAGVVGAESLAHRARDLMSALDVNGVATQAGDLASFRVATEDFIERLAALR